MITVTKIITIMSNHDQIRHEDALAVEVGADHQVDAGDVVQVLAEDAIEATASDTAVDDVQVGATVDEDAVVGIDDEDAVVEVDDEDAVVIVDEEDAVVVGSVANTTIKAANLLLPLRKTPAVAEAAKVATSLISSLSDFFKVSSEMC